MGTFFFSCDGVRMVLKAMSLLTLLFSVGTGDIKSFELKNSDDSAEVDVEVLLLL